MIEDSLVYMCEESKYAMSIGYPDKIVFAIEHDGTLWYMKDDILTKFEDEKEMGVLLLCALSGRYGEIYKDKETLFRSISVAYRDGKLESVLGKYNLK